MRDARCAMCYVLYAVCGARCVVCDARRAICDSNARCLMCPPTHTVPCVARYVLQVPDPSIDTAFWTMLVFVNINYVRGSHVLGPWPLLMGEGEGVGTFAPLQPAPVHVASPPSEW
jgi:hypothetical protein